MTNSVAKEKRDQMLAEGYCVIPDILPKEFIHELREETERLNNTMEHHPDTKYQGTHIDVKYAEKKDINILSLKGETEFLNQGIRCKPEAGKLLIWPAGWTHVHRGNPNYTTDKYIITGWLHVNDTTLLYNIE